MLPNTLPPPSTHTHLFNTHRIFSSIVSSWLTGFENAGELVPKLVNATNTVYTTIMTELLPTPTKSHYTFNLRDLSEPGEVLGEGPLLYGDFMMPSTDNKNYEEITDMEKVEKNLLCIIYFA